MESIDTVDDTGTNTIGIDGAAGKYLYQIDVALSVVRLFRFFVRVFNFEIQFVGLLRLPALQHTVRVGTTVVDS